MTFASRSRRGAAKIYEPLPVPTGPLTDRLNLTFVGSSLTSTYHIFAAGLDWTKEVGMLLWTDGSGAYGLKNPNSSYLLDADGPNGMVQVAKDHNMLLLTPIAPPPSDADGDNCWYNTTGTPPYAAEKAQWARELVDYVYSQYPIETDRVAIGGYSSGSQFTSRWFVPLHGPSVQTGGVFVPVAYGGNPNDGNNITPAYRAAVHGHWDTGTADPAYSTASWGAIGGYNWYTSNGFNTSYNWPPGVDHARDGEFAGIMDAQITAHVRPAATLGGGGGGGGSIETPFFGTAVTSDTGSSTLAVPRPSGVQVGDFLVIAMTTRGDSAFSASGWTAVEAQTSTYTRCGFLYKIADAGDTSGGSVTVSGPAVFRSMRMMAVRGVDQTTPLDAAPTKLENGSTTPTPYMIPGQTATVSGTLAVWVMTGFLAITESWTPSTGTEWMDPTQDGHAAGRSGMAAYQVISSAGPTGAKGGTPTTEADNAGVLILLRPAS